MNQPEPTSEKTLRSRPSSDAVLRLIWNERKISRADIARHTNLARSTVSEIVGALLPTGLVAEVGPGESSGGRRPIVLEFLDDSCVILGVEMGATHVVASLTDLRGRILLSHYQDHPVREDPEGTLDLIQLLSERALQDGPLGKPLVGMGIAVPCPVDPSNPNELSEIVLPKWNRHSGFERFEKHFGVPVMVDNDANLGALAEHWWGAARGVGDFAYVKVGTGVGSGQFVGGEIYRGSSGVAGEIGHIAIDPQGGLCVCGLRGCLATKIGAQALVERATELLSQFPESALKEGPITISRIEDEALAGDPLAKVLIDEAADSLGVALAGVINLLNPAMVVIGGGMARLGDTLLEPLRETVKQRTLISSLDASEIKTSDLGPLSVAVGAATLVLQAALEDPRQFPKPLPAGARS